MGISWCSQGTSSDGLSKKGDGRLLAKATAMFVVVAVWDHSWNRKRGQAVMQVLVPYLFSVNVWFFSRSVTENITLVDGNCFESMYVFFLEDWALESPQMDCIPWSAFIVTDQSWEHATLQWQSRWLMIAGRDREIWMHSYMHHLILFRNSSWNLVIHLRITFANVKRLVQL